MKQNEPNAVLTLALSVNNPDDLKIIACWQEMHRCIEEFAKWLRDNEKYKSDDRVTFDEIREVFLRIRRDEGILDIFDY